MAKVLSEPSTLGPEPPSLYGAHENEAANQDGKRNEQQRLQPATDIRRHFLNAILNEEFRGDDYNPSNDCGH